MKPSERYFRKKMQLDAWTARCHIKFIHFKLCSRVLFGAKSKWSVQNKRWLKRTTNENKNAGAIYPEVEIFQSRSRTNHTHHHRVLTREIRLIRSYRVVPRRPHVVLQSSSSRGHFEPILLLWITFFRGRWGHANRFGCRKLGSSDKHTHAEYIRMRVYY